MKRYYWLAFSLVIVVIGLFVYARNQPPPAPEPFFRGPSVSVGVGNRLPLSYWVREAEREKYGFQQFVSKWLVNEGPKIIPDLLRILRQNETPMLVRFLWSRLPAKVRAHYADCKKVQDGAARVTRIIIEQNHPWRSGLQSNVPALAAALESKNPQVRLEIASALGFFGTSASNAVPALVHCATDESSETRLGAVKSLGKIRNPTSASLKAVRAALLDRNKNVRIVATQALARLEWKRNEQ